MTNYQEEINQDIFHDDLFQETIASLLGMMLEESICITNQSGIILTVSQGLLDKFGYFSSQEIIGKNINEILKVYDEDQAQLFEAYFVKHHLNFIGIQNSGNIFSVKIKTKLIKSHSGEPRFIFNIIDTSELSKCEETEQKSYLITEALRKTATAIYSTLDFNELLEEILKQISTVISFNTASISLLDGDYFRLVAVKGFKNPKGLMGTKFLRQLTPEIMSPNCLAIKNKKSYRLGNIPIEYPLFVHPPDGTILSWLTIPLFTKNDGIGTLNLDSFSVNHFTDEDQRIGELFATQVSIALHNAMIHKEVEYNAIHDSLTGLYNRRHFYQLAEIELNQFNKETYPISFMMIDLDHFKTINDTYGHQAGDQLLSSIARICLAQMRKLDIAGRFGGEEFIIILPNTLIADAIKVAERLCQTIAEYKFGVGEIELKITASIGVSCYCMEDNINTAIGRADESLYSAKELGRNQVIAKCT